MWYCPTILLGTIISITHYLHNYLLITNFASRILKPNKTTEHVFGRKGRYLLHYTWCFTFFARVVWSYVRVAVVYRVCERKTLSELQWAPKGGFTYLLAFFVFHLWEMETFFHCCGARVNFRWQQNCVYVLL